MVILPSPRRVHAWALPVVAALALVVQSLALHVAPAGAMSNPTLTINASSSTSVGLQIFANSNLMGASNPTGTITFKLFAPGDTSCASPIFSSTVAVTSSSVNSARYTTAAAGTYRWVSTYSGDANNAAVGPTSCTDPAAAVIVDKASTALSVAAPAPAGGTIHASATLSGGFGPTGSITFLLAPPGDTFCSAPPVFTSTVAVSGARTYDSANFTPTQAGTYKWRATYTGDANSLGAGPTPCLDSNAAVTVGAAHPPAPLGSLPMGVRVERHPRLLAPRPHGRLRHAHRHRQLGRLVERRPVQDRPRPPLRGRLRRRRQRGPVLPHRQPRLLAGHGLRGRRRLP